MKKILSILCLLLIFGGVFEITASANRFDEVPPLRMASAPIDVISQLN